MQGVHAVKTQRKSYQLPAWFKCISINQSHMHVILHTVGTLGHRTAAFSARGITAEKSGQHTLFWIALSWDASNRGGQISWCVAHILRMSVTSSNFKLCTKMMYTCRFKAKEVESKCKHNKWQASYGISSSDTANPAWYATSQNMLCSKTLSVVHHSVCIAISSSQFGKLT